MLELNYEGFDKAQTDALNYASFTLGLTDQEMELIARKEYPASLMWQIIEVFEYDEGEDVYEYFKTNFEPYINLDKFSIDQICLIIEGLANGLTTEEVDLYAQNKFNDLQMGVIMDGLLFGLSRFEVSSYADPNLTPEEMEEEMNRLLPD